MITTSPMRTLASLLAGTWFAAASPSMAQGGGTREWESSDGRKITAELIDYDAASGKFKIRRTDGSEFSLTRDQVSPGDREFLEAHAISVAEAAARAAEQAAAAAGNTVRHPVPGDPETAFHVYHPTSYKPPAKLPMLILFSPGGDGAGILGAFREAAEELGWIVVGCDHLRNGMDNREGIEVFTRMLPLIEAATPGHDPEKLYLGGFSGGASRAFNFTIDFDRPWKGVISCGGWLGREPRSNDYPRNMAVVFVNGDDDNGANSYVDRDTQIFKRRRGKVNTFTFPGGHVIAPTRDLVEAMKWVAQESR